MPEYDNTLTGTLNKNVNKQGKQPDYRGRVFDSNNKKWLLSGWIRQNGEGEKFISLKLTDPADLDGGNQGNAPQRQQEGVPF